MIFVIILLQCLCSVYSYPANAFTYTTASSDFFTEVSSAGFTSVAIYGGDVELYCRGAGGSDTTDPCVFSGSKQNAFVYYTAAAKSAAAKYKNAGFTVYINFDGRINGGYVPDFSLLTPSEIDEFAAAAADNVCLEPNAVGLMWDVEPWKTDQVPFFAALDAKIALCNKNWGVFSFAEKFDSSMWMYGLNQTGMLLDSTYDLACSTCAPCKCIPPTAPEGNSYQTVLTAHLTEVKSLTTQYKKPYKLFIAGSGTTQIYEKYTLDSCAQFGQPIVYNQTCPWTMADWLKVWVNVFNSLNIANDPNYMGVAIYDWDAQGNGGLLPEIPESSFIQLLSSSGLLK